MAIGAVPFSGDFLDSLGIMAGVASGTPRCARLPCTVDRVGTADGFTSLEAWDVEELSAATSRGRSRPLFFDAATLLAASPGCEFF